MSNEANTGEWSSSIPDEDSRPESFGLVNGLDALRSSPEFRGPVEPLDGQALNEHIALFYESLDDQLSVTVPFIRQGLEQDERCIYVVDEVSTETVVEAMRDYDIDVEAALESGALEFYTIGETYLRTGSFDPDDMIDFYASFIEETTAEYTALRVTAETSWILHNDTTISKFMEYESKVNTLFDEEPATALCQYDLNAVPSDVICDIIRTHPHLIYQNTVCHNFYYTPPSEFFEPDQPNREADRMLRTLVERTNAKVELSEKVEELEESNERLKRFAYIASHDLQEPLRMISSYLQLLELQYGDELDEEANEYIGFAVEGSDRMRDMVEGLLEYSRIDMQESSFQRVETDVILENAANDLQLKIEESGAEIIADSLPAVVGDPNQLEQVFSNLLSNAIKYSGDDTPRVEVTAERVDEGWRFSVADNGIGIDPAYADQIFEVFNRLHSNDEYQGTGIGLSLCQKILAHHGGRIWVESDPGEGSTFYFTLPGADTEGQSE
ncbi:sensor histidine kinase [Haloprofundus salilacus]|uniref:sensor histidine kinase n=1 Tax=Haloprofundus salilacus TaxID=2876190 RepID=UPI001CCE2AB9|nr:MEDS domain-containing protein [Haloprofundus salilacus]